MADETIFPMVQGETGKVMTFWLKYIDSNDAEQPFDLTGKAVYLRAWRDDPLGRTIDDVACTNDPDQVTNPGKGTFTFDATTAAIIPDDHRFRFKVTWTGNVRYFPVDDEADEEPYGIIRVRPAH